MSIFGLLGGIVKGYGAICEMCEEVHEGEQVKGQLLRTLKIVNAQVVRLKKNLEKEGKEEVAEDLKGAIQEIDTTVKIVIIQLNLLT